jgi:hypothetical protein
MNIISEITMEYFKGYYMGSKIGERGFGTVFENTIQNFTFMFASKKSIFLSKTKVQCGEWNTNCEKWTIIQIL